MERRHIRPNPHGKSESEGQVGRQRPRWKNTQHGVLSTDHKFQSPIEYIYNTTCL